MQTNRYNIRTWEDFESNWTFEFRRLQNIMAFFELYSYRFKEFGFEFHTKNEILQAQRDWIGLVNKLDQKNEGSFFKSYWVPVEKEDISLFIDLSTPRFALIRIEYFMTNDSWNKIFLTHDIGEIMKSFTMKDSKLNQYEEKSFKKKMKMFDKLINNK